MAWQHWSGRDVATFVETVCGLPQYGAAMAQINGGTLQELYSKGMLQKGLTRAGVRDADHQTLIANAVSDLEYWTPEEVTSWYRENCTKPPPIPMAPSAPKPLRMAPRQKFYAKITGPMTPRQKTSTELGLQRSSKVPGHFSEERFTPIIYEKTYDFPSRGYGDVKLQELEEEVVVPPLKLRKSLARSVLDYESMRDSDSPPPGVVVKGLRGLQSLKEEEENAATKIQANFRQKQAKKEVAKKQQEKQEESAAAAKIQARYRGKKAGKEVQEMREQKGAATAIQARYRQRAVQREVDARRKEKQETEQAATRIQSRFRQRQATGEVEAMRHRRQEAEKNRRREEFKKSFAVKIDISKDPGSSQASVTIMVVPREAVDIPMNEETAQAATKIQARFRQKQAASEVDALRKRNDGQSAAVNDPADEIPDNEETALAATKIQARFRQKQAASEVAAMRQGNDGQSGPANDPADEIPDNEETALAATKIQAKFRQKQAASEVAAMRQGNDGQSGPANDPADEIPDNEETALAATKIQAKFRQKQAASEVAAMRQGNDGQSGPANDPADEIPDNEETALAATKIQAKFRQKQAASEVAAMRQGNDGQSGPANDPADEIPENEETALAATKIQAKFRQKQAASEVEAMKKEKEETAQAATKIQAKFRQKQAKNEVEAMRASAPAADPPVAEAVEAVEAVEAADDEIKAEDMKTTSEFGEVEAILAKKQKEQQDLVGDKSPKVEGMVPAAVEKRPMSVSPIIMEGDEEEEEEEEEEE